MRSMAPSTGVCLCPQNNGQLGRRKPCRGRGAPLSHQYANEGTYEVVLHARPAYKDFVIRYLTKTFKIDTRN